MAMNEYQRALFFCARDQKADLSLKTAECCFASKDFRRARMFLDSAVHYAENSDFATRCEMKKILSFMMEDNFGYALYHLNNLQVDSSLSAYSTKSLYQGICFFGLEQYDKSYEFFLNSIPKTDTQKRNQLKMLYASAKKMNRPNSSIAMVMSIVLPGMGQVYSGDIKNGLNSFLLLGGMAYLATSTLVPNPVIVVPFFLKYYLGGIVKAGEAAKKKRMQVKHTHYLCLLELLL